MAAAAGGLVSSTAVTIANARRATAGEGPPHLLAAGVAVATAMSFLRVLAIAAVLQPRLLSTIGPALIAAAATAIGFGVVSAFGKGRCAGAAPVRFSQSIWILVGNWICRIAEPDHRGWAGGGELFGAAGAIVGAIVDRTSLTWIW